MAGRLHFIDLVERLKAPRHLIVPPARFDAVAAGSACYLAETLARSGQQAQVLAPTQGNESWPEEWGRGCWLTPTQGTFDIVARPDWVWLWGVGRAKEHYPGLEDFMLGCDVIQILDWTSSEGTKRFAEWFHKTPLLGGLGELAWNLGRELPSHSGKPAPSLAGALTAFLNLYPFALRDAPLLRLLHIILGDFRPPAAPTGGQKTAEQHGDWLVWRWSGLNEREIAALRLGFLDLYTGCGHPNLLLIIEARPREGFICAAASDPGAEHRLRQVCRSGLAALSDGSMQLDQLEQVLKKIGEPQAGEPRLLPWPRPACTGTDIPFICEDEAWKAERERRLAEARPAVESEAAATAEPEPERIYWDSTLLLKRLNDLEKAEAAKKTAAFLDEEAARRLLPPAIEAPALPEAGAELPVPPRVEIAAVPLGEELPPASREGHEAGEVVPHNEGNHETSESFHETSALPSPESSLQPSPRPSPRPAPEGRGGTEVSSDALQPGKGRTAASDEAVEPGRGGAEASQATSLPYSTSDIFFPGEEPPAAAPAGEEAEFAEEAPREEDEGSQRAFASEAGETEKAAELGAEVDTDFAATPDDLFPRAGDPFRGFRASDTGSLFPDHLFAEGAAGGKNFESGSRRGADEEKDRESSASTLPQPAPRSSPHPSPEGSGGTAISSAERLPGRGEPEMSGAAVGPEMATQATVAARELPMAAAPVFSPRPFSFEGKMGDGTSEGRKAKPAEAEGHIPSVAATARETTESEILYLVRQSSRLRRAGRILAWGALALFTLLTILVLSQLSRLG